MKIEINSPWKNENGVLIDFNDKDFKQKLRCDQTLYFLNTIYLQEIILELPIKIKATQFEVFSTQKNSIYLEFNICEYKFYQSMPFDALNSENLKMCLENQFSSYTFIEFINALSEATRYKDQRRDKYLQKLKEDIIYYGN